MIFTTDGQPCSKKDWLIGIVGSPTDASYRRLTQVTVEGRAWYFDTVNGATICLRMNGLHPGCDIPARKWGNAIEKLRSLIEEWDDKASQDILAVVEVMERYPEVCHCKVGIGAGDYAEFGIGDLPTTTRSFNNYEAMRQRQYRKEWLPKELPLCPECIKLDTGHCSKDRHWCRRHMWVDLTVYGGIAFFPGEWQGGPNIKHVSGPMKSRIIDLTAKPEKEVPSQRVLAEQVKLKSYDIVLDFKRPKPGDFTDIEQLRKFGNAQIKVHQSATEAYEREHYRYSDSLKAWAQKSMAEGEEYIKALRARMQELQGHVEKTPEIVHVQETCTENQQIVCTTEEPGLRAQPKEPAPPQAMDESALKDELENLERILGMDLGETAKLKAETRIAEIQESLKKIGA